MKQKAAYEKNLTSEQKVALKDERIRMKELKEERAQKAQRKKQLSELGKPKRSPAAFVLFYTELAKKMKTNTIEVRDKYNALSESQKNVYKQKAAALAEEYR